MKRPAVLALVILGLVLLPVPPAAASLPALRLSPLKYTATLELGHPKIGYIEADNPTGATMHVTVEVEAFRQINDRGELEYYPDERLAAAIQPGLSSFDLGPREAIRVKFTIDPNRLGPGGAYGVIFLRTTSGSHTASQINTSERIGTLLILNVPGAGTTAGRILDLHLPTFVYGKTTLPLAFSYQNTGQGSGALAFTPSLTTATGWRALPHTITGPFVFPGRTRQGQTNLVLGNQFGLIPVSIQDTTPGTPKYPTHWIIAVSGFWTWLLPVLLIVLFVAAIVWLSCRRWLGRVKLRLATSSPSLSSLRQRLAQLVNHIKFKLGPTPPPWPSKTTKRTPNAARKPRQTRRSKN
ncbi:MAG TPA: hypothetical protein VHQ86_05115 [Candidatus Saccharimonadia bacterium]|jgi:hypothetical protein|nr:hypothetical protein [Candidatus Saccharimonadia bacterium]